MKKTSKYFFDKKAAQRVVTWIEKYITHVKGEKAGTPIILEKWQKEDILYPIFGMKSRITGLRKYRTVYIEIPRKNAKSTLAAAIGLYLLMADGEKGAEIYSAAADRGQAGIVFDIARRMIVNRKALSSRANVFRNSITYESNGSFYKAISSDAHTKHGFNAHGIIFDELHTQKNRELFDTLTTSVGSRRQPLTILLTTAGYDKTTICWEMHEYARRVSEGIIQDDTFLSVIYTAPKEDDIFSPKTWKKANPGYGSIVKEAYIREQVMKIKNNPSFEATFRRLHLNQWTDAVDTWISDFDWMACDKGQKKIEDYFGRKAFAGLDLATISDITALMLNFEEDNGDITIFPFFWVPEETAKKRTKSSDVNYIEWVRQGYIEATPGDVTDYNAVKKKILWIYENFDIGSFGFDKWNSSQLINDLTAEGLSNFDQVSMYLSVLSEPTKYIEKLVHQKKINHQGNPVLRWMMGNVMIMRDTNDNIRPDKGKSKNKIDGVVAEIIALAAKMSQPSEIDLNEIYKDGIEIL